MSPTKSAKLPQTIGKYQVIRELGRGATSVVYLADDPFNGRKVAVKRIHAHLLADERQSIRYRRALRNEGLLAGKLRHPYIVTVLDADIEADPPYVVLEYVEGAPLSRFTTPDRLLPIEQVLDICYKCCSALDYAQTHGLVHRDIKPANLILQGNGDVKLMDFGTALVTQGDNTQITGLVGSPMYMSPEQVREDKVDHRSDMFSLGVVLYELLTGRAPFAGESDYATMYKIGNDEPTAPSMLRPGLPKQVDDVLRRAMAKKAADRYAQWSEFGEAVLTVSRNIPKRQAMHRDGDAYARMRQLPFFSGFPDAVLWEALRLGTLSTKPAGTMLMEEGSPGESFFLLLQGTVNVLRGGWKLAALEPGVTIGEMAYLRRDTPTRTASAMAETAAMVLEIQSEALRHASEELQMCFDKAFIELLVKRLIATTDELGRQNANALEIH